MLFAARLISTTSAVYLGHAAANVDLFHQKSFVSLPPASEPWQKTQAPRFKIKKPSNCEIEIKLKKTKKP